MPGKSKYIVVILCVLFFLPVQGYGKTLAGFVKDGNKAYNAGDYDTAVTSYDRALTEDPDSPYAYFNKGAALYKKGDYTGAKEAFETAALKGRDPNFEAKTSFNLGNTVYKEAEAQMETDLQGALEGCSNSVDHYQEALRLDPGMKEAAQNMEMVRLVMKNILDEIQKQKESGQEEQAAEELNEALDSLEEDSNRGTGREDKDQQDKQQGQQQQASSPDESQKDGSDQAQEEVSAAEVSDDARDILNDEKENKEKRRAVAIGGYKEVEKDW